MTTALTCPKCAGVMRTYERNGVHVDQCTDCRGLFLDRGELEQLIDAENRHYEAPPAPRIEEPRRPDFDRGYDRRPDYDRGGYKKKKKSSFLGDLFEFGE